MALLDNKYDLNKTRYTHRDYLSIKEDLIAAIPSLTQEWTSREESDPGIVLIKLMSMFGDTLSYNVDKIALELYIQSVTQRKNCAKILKLLGYKMHWYRSARVVANVRLTTNTDSYGNVDHVILQPFTTQFHAGPITYTVANQGLGSGQVDIYSPTQAVPVKLIQGKPARSTFSKTDLVNNKYYLNARNVDESEFLLEVVNGRGVRCELVDNLNLSTSSSVIYYEFDVDEFDRPYIKLCDGWEDIAGSSDRGVQFTLTYIVTNGVLGNVSSNAFTRVTGFSSASSSNDIIITNLPNTTKYSYDGISLESYNSAGKNPQTVSQAKKDSANYVFTHDTLITSADFERAAKRVDNITVSKLVDAQVVINDQLDLDDIVSRALDKFDKVVVEEQSDSIPDLVEEKEYLKQYQAILYLAYNNFDRQYNSYYRSSSSTVLDEDGKNWSLATASPLDDPYELSNDVLNDAGFYPYKPTENILLSIREVIRKLHVLNVKVDFGTMKLFPFKVKGTLHLVEPLSPTETLQVVNVVDDALVRAYYPDLHPIGEKPNFIEIVDTIQNSDVRIKYFDAIDTIVDWAPAVKSRIDDFDDIFDTTSAIMYNGLSSKFNLHKRFLKFRLKNVGVDPDREDSSNLKPGTEGDVDIPDDYGTAYLIHYSIAKGLKDCKKIPMRSIETLQLENIEELRALCKDLSYKGLVTVPEKDASGKPTGKVVVHLVNNTGLQWME